MIYIDFGGAVRRSSNPLGLRLEALSVPFIYSPFESTQDFYAGGARHSIPLKVNIGIFTIPRGLDITILIPEACIVLKTSKGFHSVGQQPVKLGFDHAVWFVN